MRKDREAILSFWSESEDFVFAGDGRILGGFKAWSEQATRDINETESGWNGSGKTSMWKCSQGERPVARSSLSTAGSL